MTGNPRSYPDQMVSSESGRVMTRGEKLLTVAVNGNAYEYYQPGWWCSLEDPDDLDGQLVDDDNQVAQMAQRTAEALAAGEVFTPILIRAIRLQCELTQREAGEVFGTGAKSFEKYEAGEIRPSAPTKRLFQLAMERPELFKRPKGKPRLPSFADAGLIRDTMRKASLDRIYQKRHEPRAPAGKGSVP